LRRREKEERSLKIALAWCQPVRACSLCELPNFLHMCHIRAG